MTIDERRKITNAIIKLLDEVNAIEHDRKSEETLKHHIRAMNNYVNLNEVSNLKKGEQNMCKYCNEKTEIVFDEDDKGIFLSIKKDATLHLYSPKQCCDFEAEMDIKFCPMCGQRLGGVK